MQDYNRAYDTLLLHEGGYSNHPADRGGETYKGIARKFHPNWQGWNIIDEAKTKPNFPKSLDSNKELDQMCRIFYKVNYWDVNKLDEMPVYALKYEIFEIGVNMGIRVGAKILQEALNLLNRNQSNYIDMVVDGDIGPKTLSVLLGFLSNESGVILVNLINILQAERYINICRNNESQEVFLRGWLNRIEIVRR